MNEEKYVKNHTAGRLSNAVLATLTVLGAIMALIVIPFEVVRG
jgi:hypothetical protein